IQVETILDRLLLGDLLEEDPRPDPLRVLESGGAVAQLLGDVIPLEEVVPGRQRVLALGELHPGRGGMEVPEHLLPEQRGGARVTDVERDLDCGAHAVLRVQVGAGNGPLRRVARAVTTILPPREDRSCPRRCGRGAGSADAPPAQEKAAGQRTSSRMMMISSSVVRLMGRTTLRIMGSFHRGHPREGPTGLSA